MNCSEAREFFSARVDDELPMDCLSRMDTHLGNCRDCQSAWIRYRSTVALMHGLPEETTHPAFVGHVLDRIRGYEAEGRQVLDPMDTVGTSRWSWMENVRSWMDQFVLRPIPAMALGSLVIGVALGSWVNHVSSSGESPGNAAVASVESEGTNDSTRLQPVLTPRPFEDLTDEIAASRALEPTTRAQFYSPNWGGTGVQQQVRFENDGPRIIF